MGHEKVPRLPFCTCPCDILSAVSILRSVFEQLVNSCAVTMLKYTRCNIVILVAATAWLMLSFSSRLVCGFDSHTVLFQCPRENFLRYTNQIRTRYRNWRTSARQLQPSKSLCYIRYTSIWLDVRCCVLMQKATTCNIFYDGISFQHLATVLISVFTLCYGTGLLFRGQSV